MNEDVVCVNALQLPQMYARKTKNVLTPRKGVVANVDVAAAADLCSKQPLHL